jgi:hypothetical protein
MATMKALLLAILLCLTAAAGADAPGFEVDEQLQKKARLWAEEFVQFAANRYEVELDFSGDSIKYLDDIANDLHRVYLAESPPEAQIVPVARALGSYIAEVYRIRKGGPWGWVSMEEGSFPGVQAKSGATFLPFAKALDRIKTGEEPDLWEYFRLLLAR